MVNKNLVEWIKSQESKGYSEQQIRESLLGRKYNWKDVEDAIALAKSSRGFEFKEFIKPTPLKLFLPILFLILIFVSFFVNSFYAPDFSGALCNMLDIHKEEQVLASQEEEIYGFDSNPEEIIRHLESKASLRRKSREVSKESYEFLKPIYLWNTYFYMSMAYKINPLFPVACEWSTINSAFPSNFRCSYYIDEEGYNCALNGSRLGYISFFNGDLPSYNKISFIDFFMNALLLVVIIYVIVCFVTYIFNKLSLEKNKTKILSAIILLILPVFFNLIYSVISELLGIFYWILFYSFVILFVTLLFIKDNRMKNIILYVSAGFFVLFLVLGIFFLDDLIDRRIEMGVSQVDAPPQFKTIYCDNTRVLDVEKLDTDLIQVPPGAVFRECYNPSCSTICQGYCQSIGESSLMVFSQVGNNPFCICQC